MTDLRRTIIIHMAVACVINIIGVIHCHINNPYIDAWYGYQTTYSIIFPILLALTGFIFIEQLLITDGTAPPLNRLRIIYAFSASIALILFGINAVVVANRWHKNYSHNAIIAAAISFIDAVVYFSEAIFRNRKAGIV